MGTKASPIRRVAGAVSTRRASSKLASAALDEGWADLTRAEREAYASGSGALGVESLVFADVEIGRDEVAHAADRARARLRMKRAGAYAARAAAKGATAAYGAVQASASGDLVEAEQDPDRVATGAADLSRRAYGRYSSFAQATASKGSRAANKAVRTHQMRKEGIDAPASLELTAFSERLSGRAERMGRARRRVARIQGAFREGGVRGAARIAARAARGKLSAIRSAFAPTRLACRAATGAIGLVRRAGLRALAAVAPAAILILLASALLNAVTAAAGGALSRDDGQTLSAVEAHVASFFKSKGLDDLHTAAIMGNMYAESGMNPERIQDGKTLLPSSPTNADIIMAGTKGSHAIGLCQWDFGRRRDLAVYADSVENRPWTDVDVQLDYFWHVDEWATDWGSGSNTKSAFLMTSNLDEATRIFCFGWERPAASSAHLSARIMSARRYYADLISGTSVTGSSSGQRLSDPSVTDAQRRVVSASYEVTYAQEGYCAAYVSYVIEAAGFGSVSGNACDMYARWTTTSNTDELKVGMIVAVPSHPGTSAGKTYGHVGVYIGDGKVRDNIGGLRDISLDEWIAYYGKTSTPRWGWANGIDLSAR